MSFYGNMAVTTQRMIADKGRSVTLRRSANTYNPATDTYTASSTDFTVKAVFTEFRQSEIDATLIKRGDKKLLIAAADLSSAPEPNDIIIDGSTQYRVIDLMSVEPGDAAILYKVQVRK
jgi:hypothetical protein